MTWPRLFLAIFEFKMLALTMNKFQSFRFYLVSSKVDCHKVNHQF